MCKLLGVDYITSFSNLSFAAVVLTDVVPKCDYYPSYAYVHKVKRYTGVFAVEDSFVYPDDHTELDMVRRNKWKAEGNPIIDPSVSGFFVRLAVMHWTVIVYVLFSNVHSKCHLNLTSVVAHLCMLHVVLLSCSQRYTYLCIPLY